MTHAASVHPIDDDRLAAFKADLLSGETATMVLERWCGGPIHARRDLNATAPAPDGGTRLSLGEGEMVAYREVHLTHRAAILSETQLWYVPARLTAGMNRELAETDRPFGRIIRPLRPVRHTLSVERGEDRFMLHVRALVVDGTGRSLGEVSERYTLAAIS